MYLLIAIDLILIALKYQIKHLQVLFFSLKQNE
jgi:hypothetical protein